MVLTQLLNPEEFTQIAPEKLGILECHLHGLILSNPKYHKSVGALKPDSRLGPILTMKVLSNPKFKAELKDLAMKAYKSMKP